MKKFLIIAPFWDDSRHVGTYRLNRFVRWLMDKNVPVVLVKAGANDRVEPAPWGQEVTIRDSLGVYRETPRDWAPASRMRPFFLVARWIARRILIPDAGIVWAWRAGSHPLIRQNAEGITHVIASNPPESPHLAALRIAGRLKARLVVDMRDGWLDEPLRPLLQRSRIRRWCEGAIEKQVLKRAAQVFVTSEVWREVLETRLPFTKGKIAVLTNAYPSAAPVEARKALGDHKKNGEARPLRLAHVGRFTGSSNSRHTSHLLMPLLDGIRHHSAKGELIMMGDLTSEDLAETEVFGAAFGGEGWSIAVRSHGSRSEALKFIGAADGLLLLSTSHAAIPSKLFEYIPTSKPILAFAPADSAVWRVGQKLPQMHVVDYRLDNQESSLTIGHFLDACSRGSKSAIPAEFSEASTARIFNAALTVG